LSKLLKENKIFYYDIKGRLKSPYRIYKKLQKYQTRDISKVMDILAFRIITDTVPNCYNILGLIHSKYTPIIKKIKDYIAVPKPNGYQSLHTTILGMFKFPVEIQIRTKEMDIKAEY
jgi:GTP pyrophosphokinase